jgi:hypothetical protein
MVTLRSQRLVGVSMGVGVALGIGCGSSPSTSPGLFAIEGGLGSGSGAGTSTGSSAGGTSTENTTATAIGSTSGTGTGVGSGSSTAPGTPIACSNPGTYTHNGGACGTERWDIKTGTDPYTSSVSLAPQMTTIAALVALPAAGGGADRESPTETTLWQLTDVTLTELKLESDSDEHLVVSDGTHTMLVEVPYPTCATGSPWLCFITHVRSELDAKYTVGSSPQYPSATVTIRGVGFFDYAHGQTGVAPNAIELHPALQICFGEGCTPE